MKENKAREFWLTGANVQTKVDGGFVQETRMALTFIPGVQILGEHIHVIERSAYDKAIAALKEIEKYFCACSVDDETPPQITARETLKELGELK